MFTRSLFLPIAMALFSSSVAAAELNAFLASKTLDSACWSRDYTAQHLADHPHQQVVSMDLAITYLPANEYALAQHVFRLEARLRDGRKGVAIGPCSNDGRDIWCGVECDGGGIHLTSRSQNRVLVDLERVGSIAMSYSCGDEDTGAGFALESGIDDKQFLLTEGLPQFCLPVEY